MEIIKPSVVIETPESHIKDYLQIVEKIGRVCHKSEKSMTDNSDVKFVEKLIEIGHESVLEHCHISARFVCDRTASHQLVRHRIGSFSQESQRVVDYSKEGLQVICPPSIRQDQARFALWRSAIESAESEYLVLLGQGVLPEDARSILPNCTKTEVVATFNLRMWRHIFMQRALNPKAQWQIREMMAELLKQMYTLLPPVFEDLKQKILYKLVFDEPIKWSDD